MNLFGISAESCFSKSDYYSFRENHTAKLILLDINLEDGSGFEICKEIRSQGEDAPIIFISARNAEQDQVLALSIGGDDYIVKPYSLSVLHAKIRAILNRIKEGEEKENIYENDSFSIDFSRSRVYKDGKEVPLKAMEYKLLDYLVKNKGQVLSKDDLFENVWEDAYVSDGILNVHIHHLREKLEEDAKNPIYIKTVWGRATFLMIR